MQQLYAKIKKSSPYYREQMRLAKNNDAWGWPFPVENKHQPKTRDIDYVVQGGPGQIYRLADVNIFIIDLEKEIKIS